ncbi:hypothetical protein CTI12_AA473760 [Artemisia annua]|uniref:OTU domain-containing protein n=1 Tax=Artemisia annua TaxID=35608 RepID=A0A2U1LNA5_ARTAN|nr:hypothetical protein CTI12_AA473760 [Artemisia annua]
MSKRNKNNKESRDVSKNRKRRILGLKRLASKRLPQPQRSKAKKNISGQLQSDNVMLDGGSNRMKLVKRQRNTLKIYKEWLGYKTPRVLIDGPVLVHVIENNMPLKNFFHDALEELNVELYTTNCVIQEVECYMSKYSGLKDMNAFTELKEQLIVKCCGHTQEVSSADCLKFVVGEDNKHKFFVATNDKCFSENPLIPILSVDKGIFGIKYLSRNEKRRALKLYSKYSLSEPAIMEDDSPLPYDHPESPEYKRLMARIQFYCFAQIKVVDDGNCLSRALSDQLTHSQWKYKQVREALVKQMRSNQSLYEQKVRQLLDSDPEFEHETYSDYVNRKSEDKECGDSVMMQAAADRFQAKLVCLCSLKTFAILEYFPYGLAEYKRVLYLASLARSHADSIYPKSSPSKKCSHLYSLGSSL